MSYVKNIKFYYFSLLVCLVLVSMYHLYFGRKVIPGVNVAGVNVGGMTYKQATRVLGNLDESTQKTLVLSLKDKNYKLDDEEMYLEYSWDATISRAFEVGRTGNVFVDSKDKLAGIFKKLHLPAFYNFEEDPLNRFLISIQGEVNSLAKNAKYVIVNDGLEIESEEVGLKVDEEKLYSTVIDRLGTMNFDEIKIPTKVDEPTLTVSDLELTMDEAQNIVFNPLHIAYKDKSWVVSNIQKLNFLTFKDDENHLGFDKTKFKAYLEPISFVVNELPKGKVTAMNGDRVTGFELVKDGLEVDVDSTTEAFKEAYFGLHPTAEIVVNTISGTANPGDYGIFALLGEGKSKFTGSASGRIHNLTLAAERTDGVLVPPGTIYSMNDAVGEISAATGYDSAWIILGDRTVLGHGGGVCQTSTTLFRAILDAGLPVVERNPHAYRVRYYELESHIGIDASIYQPSLDLKFKNDTANHVLIESSWDLENSSLAFRIYGTPDGREVYISEPVVTNQSSPPEALYQEDSTLAKGIVRQIDFPAWGANVSFTRTVTRGDDVLYNDVFKTYYQPWRAIYLVGTK